MTHDLILQISKIISEFNEGIDRKIPDWESVRGSKAFREMEVEISVLTRSLADQISEKILRAIVLNGRFQQQSIDTPRKTGKYRNGLASLGNDFGVTAAAVSEICRQVADSDSVRSGRQTRFFGDTNRFCNIY
jgi:hypothetical protein